MVQAAVFDCQLFDLFSPFNDSGVSAEVGVGRGDVFQTFVVAVVIVMIDELADLVFKITRQIIVLLQDAVLQCVMPTLDLALGLRMIRRTTNVIHVLVLQPISEIAGDVRRAVVAEQAWLVNNLGTVAA